MIDVDYSSIAMQFHENEEPMNMTVLEYSIKRICYTTHSLVKYFDGSQYSKLCVLSGRPEPTQEFKERLRVFLPLRIGGDFFQNYENLKFVVDSSLKFVDFLKDQSCLELLLDESDETFEILKFKSFVRAIERVKEIFNNLNEDFFLIHKISNAINNILLQLKGLGLEPKVIPIKRSSVETELFKRLLNGEEYSLEPYVEEKSNLLKEIEKYPPFAVDMIENMEDSLLYDYEACKASLHRLEVRVVLTES